jgi:hypothetical protein
MGIIGNKTLFHKLPLTQVGGLFASDIATIPNWHCKENASKLASVPNGYYAGGAWILPETRGNVNVDGGILGSHLFLLNLAGGININSNVDGVGNISSASLGALAFLISSLSQSSTFSGDILGAVSIASDLAGSGELDGALGALVSILADLNGDGDLSSSISGAVQAIANLSGSGDIQGAIKATVDLLSNIGGTSSLSSVILGNWSMVVDILSESTLTSNILAKAFLETNFVSSNSLNLTSGAVVGSLNADITSLSELSPESLASSVWRALASQFNDAGTMGAKLNSASAAGDPWGATLPGAYLSTEAGGILAKIQLLVDELHKIQGLDPLNEMTVTPYSRTAGTINLDISGNGETETTVTRND